MVKIARLSSDAETSILGIHSEGSDSESSDSENAHELRHKKRDSYEVIKNLGLGGFGVVRHVKNEVTQRSYAVKTSTFPEHDGLIRREDDILELIRSKGGDRYHIVKKEFLGTFEDKPALFLEFIQGKDLLDHAQDSGLSGILVRDIQNVARQVLDALAFLAEEKIVHGDIKPENILIDANKKITVVDFGLAFEEGRAPEFLSCTFDYASPEVAVGFSLDSALDVWSLGVTLISVYTNSVFFGAEKRPDIISSHEGGLNKIYPDKLQNEYYREVRKKPFSNNKSDSIWIEISRIGRSKGEDHLEVRKFCGFIDSFLELDPEVRITAKKALEHDFCLNKESL
jgi:serine/threonine protein kinase